MATCAWCGKNRRSWSDWEQETLRNGWKRLCALCAKKRLRNPWSALLAMRRIDA